MSLPASTPPTSVRRHLLLPFFAYFLLLASTSFIAGGIVHLGLGENTAYYAGLAVLGIVCFTIGNYLQEFVLRKNARAARLGPFLLVSFVLSIGIGMVTGGVQHFIDNPPYSTVLIPVGLMLSVTAFAWREGVSLGGKLPALLGGTVAVAALLFGGLSSLARTMSSGEAGHAHGAATPAQAAVTSTGVASATTPAVAKPAQDPQKKTAVTTAPQEHHGEATTDGHQESSH